MGDIRKETNIFVGNNVGSNLFNAPCFIDNHVVMYRKRFKKNYE